MPIQVPPLFPKPPFKLPRERILWTAIGHVLDSSDRPVGDVLVKCTDKETNTVIEVTRTDAEGWFNFKLIPKDAGYRIQPSQYPYAFCPGYYDVMGNTDMIFHCITVGK